MDLDVNLDKFFKREHKVVIHFKNPSKENYNIDLGFQLDYEIGRKLANLKVGITLPNAKSVHLTLKTGLKDIGDKKFTFITTYTRKRAGEAVQTSKSGKIYPGFEIVYVSDASGGKKAIDLSVSSNLRIINFRRAKCV